MGLVAQGLAGLQRVGDALLGFLLAAEGDEGFAFQIQHVLLADHLRRGEWPASQDVRQLSRDVRIVFRGEAAAHEQVDGQFRPGEKLLAQNLDLRGLRAFSPICHERLVAAAQQS